MTDTRLDPERYFALIDTDTERLLDLGRRGLDPAVPSCPGWTVADLVRHVAMVYEHKVQVMAANRWPDPWPPPEPEEREPLDLLGEAKAELFAEFARHDVTEPTTTFSPDDATIGFWIRRMAHEAAIHRYDAELAHHEPGRIPEDEAVDGIDELLRVFLEVDEGEGFSTEFPIDALVAVEAGGRRWVCDLRETSAQVLDEPSGDVVATISGDPATVLLWLWGRAGDRTVQRSGNHEIVAEFRDRLLEVTQ
jgi:uncharacterized protein (TIGR03083 family)